MIKLYRHQEMALTFMRLFDNYALFMEQGCGKTLPCLFRILELIKQRKIKTALVVAPKAAMGAWSRDIDRFDEDDKKLLYGAITVVNYEAVWRKTKYDVRWLNSKKYNPTTLGDYDREWDLIILDESHKIKNRTSKQAQMVHHLALYARYRYILTGTPISNGSLENIWSQYAFLRPYLGNRGAIYSKIFGGSYYDFLHKYCILNQWYQPYKYIHVDELQQIIGQHSYRVQKKDCLDLPEKLPDEIYSIELKDKAKYKELHKYSSLTDYDFVADNSLVRQLKLRQFCSGFFTAEDGTIVPIATEKYDVLSDFLDDWDKKLVIFAEYKESIKRICEVIDSKKIRYVVLDGEQKNKSIWKDFQSDDKIRIIVCQYKSGNAGIDLFAADTILYFEPTISSNVLEQSRDRIHRTGQTQKCSYIHFITKGTIEEAIYNALQGFCDFDEKLFKQYIEQYQKGISYRS
jgi:SNF2 family DNA or RNA helicase